MHSGDGDAILQAHQLRQHLGALDDRNVEGVSLGYLWIVWRNGRAGHDHVGADNVFSAVSFKNHGTEADQALRDRRTLEVGTGNLVAEVQQHLGDTAHADAADSDEMNALNLGENFRSTASPRIYADET